jgi:hypothetical protein
MMRAALDAEYIADLDDLAVVKPGLAALELGRTS